MHTETVTIYSYSELSEEAKATAYKAREPDYLDDVILGPAKQPTEGKVFGNVIEECLDSRTSRKITNLNFTKMVFVYDIGKSRWQADFGREALEFGRDHFTIDTGNYLITVDPKRYRIFDRAAGKPLVNGVVRIDEQDMKDILAAAPKSQRGWIRTRLGYMVVL